MLSVVCAALRVEYPELQSQIDEIEKILTEASPFGCYTADVVARRVSAPVDTVRSLFRELVGRDVLREEVMLQCPRCSTYNDKEQLQQAVSDGDTFECTQCQTDLTKQESAPIEIVVYYRKMFSKDQSSTSNPTRSIIPASVTHIAGKERAESTLSTMDLLRYYAQDQQFISSEPFARKRFIFLLHFLTDLLPFVEAAERLGMDIGTAVFFRKNYPYKQGDEIEASLRRKGALVFSVNEINAYLGQLNRDLSSAPRQQNILIVEDGGHLVKAFHFVGEDLSSRVVGAVEQTTRGIMNARECKPLRFPIISVAKCRLKNEFEPPYVASAIISNIQLLLPNASLRGKGFALLGFGAIGEHVAKALKDDGAMVHVFDTDPHHKLKANQQGFEVHNTSAEAVKDVSFIIGTSGQRSVDSSTIAALQHGAYLISGSSETYEIDLDELERQSKRIEGISRDDGQRIGKRYICGPTNRIINVLADGEPINFWNAESMPNEASDLVMSLLLLSSVFLAQGKSLPPQIDEEVVNQMAERHNLAQKYLEFHPQ